MKTELGNPVNEGFVIGIDYAIAMTEHAIKWNKDLEWLLAKLEQRKAEEAK